MARIRTIKPDFFSDEDIAELPFEIQRFYIGLWTEADKSGRMEDRPRRLAVKLMAYYPKFDAEKALDVLTQPKKYSDGNLSFVQRYTVNGCRYLQIIAFNEHQRPHHTEPDSVLPPAPPYEEGKGRERKGECSSPRTSGDEPVMNRSCTVRISFNPEAKTFQGISESDIAIWAAAYPACDIHVELNKMVAWLLADWPRRKKSAWKRFIQGWLNRGQDKGGTKSGNYVKPSGATAPPGTWLKNQKEKDDDEN